MKDGSYLCGCVHIFNSNVYFIRNNTENMQKDLELLVFSKVILPAK